MLVSIYRSTLIISVVTVSDIRFGGKAAVLPHKLSDRVVSISELSMQIELI
jgi:hypothetical protein